MSRQAVLVVTHPDGFVEVFGGSTVDVRCVDMPAVTGPEAERLAEEYVGLAVPRRYQDVYYPSARRAIHLPERLAPSDIARRDWTTHVFRGIQQATEEPRVWIS